MNFPTPKEPYDRTITISFTPQEYMLLLWVTGAGYRTIQEKGQAYMPPAEVERLDQLRAHILSADLFDRTV